MKKKIFLTILLVFLTSIFVVNAYATGFLDEIIDQGNEFGGSSDGMGEQLDSFLRDKIIPIVASIGNLVFAAVTVILGAKYIWSGADGRSQVMETLPAFVAAVIFFYLGETIVVWLTGATGGIAGATEWKTIEGKIFGTICNVVRYASFGGLIFMGLKYMLASAEGKSQIKTNMGGVILGIVFVFLASNVVNFIIDMAESVI